MAIETFAKHRITLREYLLAWEAGAFDQRTELLDGEVWDVSIGSWHGDVTGNIVRMLPNGSVRITTSSLVSGDSLPDPDCWVRRKGSVPVEQLSPRMTRWAPEDVLLVVEVSDETRNYDLSRKADMYAEAGFAHYWVAAPEGIYAFEDPADGRYGRRILHKLGETVAVPYTEGVELAVEELISPEG